LPPARLEFAKSVILDTSTYSSHPQRDGGLATRQRHWMMELSCWRGSTRDMSMPYQPTNSSRNLYIRRCVMASACFKTTEGTFRLPETETRMTPWSMHLEQKTRRSMAIVQPNAPRTARKQGPSQENFTPNMLAFAPVFTYLSHWSSFFRRSDRSMTGQTPSTSRKLVDGPPCINIMRTANH
jgi:hypothetical protein